jgi:hypothetical protein
MFKFWLQEERWVSADRPRRLPFAPML